MPNCLHIYSGVEFLGVYLLIRVLLEPSFRIDEVRLHTFAVITTLMSRGVWRQRTKLMNELSQLIRDFIQTIPSGLIIDAHTVIEHLAKNCGDAYLDGYSNGEGAAHYHSRISKMIGSSCEELLTRIDCDCYSENMHCGSNRNACWKRN